VSNIFSKHPKEVGETYLHTSLQPANMASFYLGYLSLPLFMQ